MTSDRLIALFLIALLAGCGGDSAPTDPGVTVASVVVTGPSTIEVGKTVPLGAAALDAAAHQVVGPTFTWSSSNVAIATVGPTGQVTGVATGAVSITATLADKSGSLAMTVIPAIASLTITGTTASQVGVTTALVAVAKDAAGATIAGLPITWSSNDPTIIAVANDGMVTATRIGTAAITAAVGSKSATVSFTSSLTPYTFNFPVGVSATDQQTIRDGVQYAHAYHQTVFSRQIQQATTVSALTTPTGGCAQGGAAAFTGVKAVTFCLGNPGWTQNPAIQRQKIVQHELFHVWQFEYKWLGNPTTAGANWVIEGSAELMGFHGVDNRGLLAFATALGCQVKMVADFAVQSPPGLPALGSVETQQAFATTVGPLYAQSLLAMDQLTTNGGGLTSLKTYTDAIADGTAWQTAFQTSFGMTTSAFYGQFPAYRAGQAVPPAYLCGV